MRVYLDSAPLIYLVENVSPYAEQLMERLNDKNNLQVCSSLTRLECRVQPMRDGEVTLLAAFDTYFDEIIHEIVPLSRPVIDLATEVRAHYNFKMPDSIHLACAISSDCDLFLTNDAQLKRCIEISVELISNKNL